MSAGQETKLRVVDAYSWLYDIVRCVIMGVPIPIDEANIIGSRKSGKTASLLISYIMLTQASPNSFGWVNARERTKDAIDMFKDMESMLKSYNVPYTSNKADMEITVNGNTCRFYGVDNNRNTRGAKKAGIPHFNNVKYLFIFFEERFEFSEEHVRAVVEAVRSVSNDPSLHPQMVILNACNPWSKNNDYIAYCGKYLTWDAKVLKETGNQIKLVEIPLRDGHTKRALFQYTNWRVCKEFLSDSEIKTILDTWNIDPRRAATVDLGLPGSEAGAIYTHLLNTIGEAVWREQEWLIAGGDYGWGRDERSGKTVFYFGGATLEDGIDLYGEYVQDNHAYVKEPNKVAREVVDFYMYQMEQYRRRNAIYGSIPELRVRVDNMAIGFIDILNMMARQRGLSWLTFIRCKKFPIPDRIELTLSIMASHKLRVATNIPKYQVRLLRNEMEFSSYEDSRSGKQNRIKKDDHAINAFEYAIENIMYKFNKEIPNEKRAGKALW